MDLSGSYTCGDTLENTLEENVSSPAESTGV